MTTKKARSEGLNASDASHADATTAITTWRACEAEAEAAITHCQAVRAAVDKARGADGGSTPEKRLSVIAAEIRLLEAQHAVKVSRPHASRAQDAGEVAAGDALAILCDPSHIHAELEPEVDAMERKLAEFREIEKRFWARIGAAQTAWDSLARRRQQAKLPNPVALPRPAFSAQGAKPADWLTALTGGAAITPAVPHPRIAELRREETEIRAGLEQDRIDREEAVARQAREREAERRASERNERQRNQEREKELAKVQAERDRVAALAEAHRARAAG